MAASKAYLQYVLNWASCRAPSTAVLAHLAAEPLLWFRRILAKEKLEGVADGLREIEEEEKGDAAILQPVAVGGQPELAPGDPSAGFCVLAANLSLEETTEEHSQVVTQQTEARTQSQLQQQQQQQHNSSRVVAQDAVQQHESLAQQQQQQQESEEQQRAAANDTLAAFEDEAKTSTAWYLAQSAVFHADAPPDTMAVPRAVPLRMFGDGAAHVWNGNTEADNVFLSRHFAERDQRRNAMREYGTSEHSALDGSDTPVGHKNVNVMLVARGVAASSEQPRHATTTAVSLAEAQSVRWHLQAVARVVAPGAASDDRRASSVGAATAAAAVVPSVWQEVGCGCHSRSRSRSHRVSAHTS